MSFPHNADPFFRQRAVFYNYNDRGELVSANDTTSTDRDRGYLYDKIGNRLATGGVYSVSAEGVESVTDPVTYTPNSLNQYSVANGVPLPAAGHDQDGNLRFDGGVNKASESREYLWDAENRLVEVRTTGANPATLVTYEYDHLSRLVVRTDGEGTTCFLFDGWNRLAEYSQDATGQVLKRSYVWGMDLSGTMQGAGGVGGLLAVSEHDAATGAVTETYFPAFDGNGNITEYIDSDKFIVAHFEYDPFGNLVVDSEENAATFPYRFSTKPEDPVTGLYYYGYRWYDPLTGRWPSRDPIGERGGINLYGFVGNDGVDWVDLLGQEHTITSGGGATESYSYEHGSGTPNGTTRFYVTGSVSDDGKSCTIFINIPIKFKSGVTNPRGGDGGQNGIEDLPGYKPYDPGDEANQQKDLAIFQAGIDKAWNNGRFKVCCKSISAMKEVAVQYGKRKITTRFTPCCCDVVVRLVLNPPGSFNTQTIGLFNNSDAAGADQYNLNLSTAEDFFKNIVTPGQQAAHEVGHFLGNIDEYDMNGAGPGKNPVSTGNKRPYGPKNPVTAKDSIMNSSAGHAYVTHLWRVENLINASGGVMTGCKFKDSE